LRHSRRTARQVILPPQYPPLAVYILRLRSSKNIRHSAQDVKDFYKREIMKLNTQTILSYLVSLLVPLALIGTALRILLSPIFVNVEYRMSYFPADEYGMTGRNACTGRPSR
jgi:hypothetical protein